MIGISEVLKKMKKDKENLFQEKAKILDEVKKAIRKCDLEGDIVFEKLIKHFGKEQAETIARLCTLTSMHILLNEVIQTLEENNG